jgi:cob(I)alamin adenosyltransferase
MTNKAKIYTKTGDKGKTSLIDGSRVPKYHIRLETYGTVDELNSYIGLIRDQKIDKHYYQILLEIQNRLFDAGSLLACSDNGSMQKLPKLKQEDILLLENEIDSMNALIPELHSFILPGGNILVSYCQIARCVCRRAERTIFLLLKDHPVDEIILKYFNRLSDYLFVLARKIGQDNDVSEIPWKARK